MSQQGKNYTLPLTKHEIAVAQLLCYNHSNKQIADLLKVSPKTIEKHRAACYLKMRVNTQLALLHYCINHTIINFINWSQTDFSVKESVALAVPINDGKDIIKAICQN